MDDSAILLSVDVWNPNEDLWICQGDLQVFALDQNDRILSEFMAYMGSVGPTELRHIDVQLQLVPPGPDGPEEFSVLSRDFPIDEYLQAVVWESDPPINGIEWFRSVPAAFRVEIFDAHWSDDPPDF